MHLESADVIAPAVFGIESSIAGFGDILVDHSDEGQHKPEQKHAEDDAARP
jgi:hypothetical protein